MLGVMLRCGVLLLMAYGLQAQMPEDTIRLRAGLVAVRGTELTPDAYARLRGEFFAWLDARVGSGRDREQINRELRAAGLFVVLRTADDRRPGYVEPVQSLPVAHAPELLAWRVTMHRGTACDWDETVLLYDRRSRKRVAALRAADDARQDPFTLLAMDAARQASGALVTGTLWVVSNCTSTWNGQHLRMERVDGGGSAVLLDRDVDAQQGGNEEVRVTEGLVRFRYNAAVGDTELFSTPVLANYRIAGDAITRVPPYALTRAGFLLEWLKENRQPLPPHGVQWGTLARCADEIHEVETRAEPARVFRMQGSRAGALRMLAVKPSRDPACRALPEGDFHAIAQPLPE